MISRALLIFSMLEVGYSPSNGQCSFEQDTKGGHKHGHHQQEQKVDITKMKLTEEEHPLGNVEVFIAEDIGRFMQEQLVSFNVSVDDEFSLTFKEKPGNTDTFHHTQTIYIMQRFRYNESAANERRPLYRFLLERKRADVFRVTDVSPKRPGGPRMWPLFTSNIGSHYPFYMYSTDICIRDEINDDVEVDGIHMITMRALVAHHNGGHLHRNGRNIHLTFKFLKPFFYYSLPKVEEKPKVEDKKNAKEVGYYDPSETQ